MAVGSCVACHRFCHLGDVLLLQGTRPFAWIHANGTVYSNSVVHDSVDRWHTHYEFIKGDTLHMIDTFYRDRWHVAHDTAYKTVVDVQTRDVEKVVEKKVYVWWPSLIIIVSCVAGFCFYKIKKRKK